MVSRYLAAFAVLLLVQVAPSRAEDQSFAAFTTELWKDAQAKGITRATFDTAMKGVTPDQRVIAATKRQPEYGKPVGDYVNAIVSNRRIADAQLKAREWAKTFDAVEKKFQVERWVLLALWGMESDFGAEKDRWDVFRSLATLAYIKYRDPYFRNELLVAMQIMQNSRLPREKMVSSWAGAMGQTQFMPTNFVDYAIDFSGDGRADIWANVPDVLASTAQLSAQMEVECRAALGLRSDGAEGLRLYAQPRDLHGMGSAWPTPCGWKAVSDLRRRESCFSRAAPMARALSSRKISMS